MEILNSRKDSPPFAAKQMGWQLCAGSQTEELRPGRPEGLPRTAAIKNEYGHALPVSYFDGCGSNSVGLRNPIADCCQRRGEL